MHLGYKVEDKLHLGVREQEKVNISALGSADTVIDMILSLPDETIS
jgi:hypothetical protein